ncbi:glutamine-hydrolyzing carbamoyl-phosphate synthase small subunit [Enterobacteriaceae endosymbiont of Donacia cincticornis]|uniref:glutamine-hydrolyzing carbamoyl-phosphate synthase small subunit n=1 Tax=Enterobacteriaceae endosymbiont of Donacia cincticornis TaxID=2675773 RepID=UPI001449AE2E|nr:glutamine-hydrolyzing carbamoyl-phosphate synthase small subunit [Enterobacteriaceae endosymbiont of Donacia cincticornis]QJC36072.1 glutamine-hydrolyzing carbamoyl-phosphate synthase small subunit [Enterobacteriaceae endosymbiont of Donacia cincticornis]
MENNLNNKAIILMENGTKIFGNSIGIDGIVIGEIIFNTAITGYQEILTDPSYYKQIIILTYPHIGNVGTNIYDNESSKIYAKGLIINNLSKISSNYRSTEELDSFLKKKNIVAIEGIDTRYLTRLIRDKKINKIALISTKKYFNYKKILHKIRKFKGLQGLDLVKDITTKKTYSWKSNHKNIQKHAFLMHVVVLDFGVKNSILKMLVDRKCKVTIVSAFISYKNLMLLNPDGIFLSNGPGDPTPCNYIIDIVKKILTTNIPIFGVCFGHQILAIAYGAKIIKMDIGHHGSNHPVKDLKNNKVLITTQNHNFTIDKNNFPKNLKITHKSLFDDTIEGIHCINKPAFGFQGHPEASPGPHDSSILFDYFIKKIHIYCKKKYKRF